ncbi:hypothetical protein [uncultured Enterobacter sp.]|nr:hypothetical protein [uncultured Enterobacter sp.]
MDKWYGMMENPTLADAILHRVVHNARRRVLRKVSIMKNKPIVGSD